MSVESPDRSADDDQSEVPSAWVPADPHGFEPVQVPNAEPTAPPPPLPGAQRWRRIRRVVLLAVVAALVVAAAFVIPRGLGYHRTPGADRRPSTGAVQFLQAVADGDADRALALQHQAPEDRTLLTDDVLDRSRRLTPISRIEVIVDNPERVEISYLLGQEEVHAQFDPVRQPDGSYRIERGTTTVQVNRPDQLEVFVNGVRLTADTVEAFPGTYQLATGLENIEYVEPLFTVSGPETEPQLAPSPRLSTQGAAAFMTAVRDRLAACMQSREVNPPDCPQSLNIAEGTLVDPASVRWALEEDPFVAVTPKLSLTDETVAEVRLSIRARLQALVTTPTGPGMVNQSATFETLATGQVTSDPINIKFVTR